MNFLTLLRECDCVKQSRSVPATCKTVQRGCAGPSREQGAALIVSLVIVATMLIIGLATMSSSQLNTLIVTNVQQKAQVSEVTESGLTAIWNVATIRASLFGPSAPLVWDEAGVEIPVSVTQLDTAFDNVDSYGLDYDGNVSINYCGERRATGGDLNADLSATPIVSAVFEINSTAQAASINAAASHTRRGGTTTMRTGRTGAC